MKQKNLSTIYNYANGLGKSLTSFKSLRTLTKYKLNDHYLSI